MMDPKWEKRRSFIKHFYNATKLIAVILWACSVASLVHGLAEHHQQRQQCTQHNQSSRRGFLSSAMFFAGGVIGGIADSGPPTIANGACLPGDLSKDCIGVYKLPYIDATESSWLYDRDTLREFAPDIRYIEVEKRPKTFAEAKTQLLDERRKIKQIKEVVLDGNLEQAGTIVLNLIPKVTSAGLKIQDDLFAVNDDGRQQRQQAKVPGEPPSSSVVMTSSMGVLSDINRRKFENSLQIVVAEWSSIDIAIGQAIRGQRGVTAVAQIEILSYLKDATVALDDFIQLVNDNEQQYRS